MRRTFLVLTCVSILAAPLAVNSSAFAQGVGSTPSNAPPSAAPQYNERDNDRAEHRELREERERLRVEHEELMDERDKLKSECMDAKGQDRANCEEKKRNLHDRMEDWRRRRQDFNEKMESEHQEHSHAGHAHEPPTTETWPQPTGSSGPSSP